MRLSLAFYYVSVVLEERDGSQRAVQLTLQGLPVTIAIPRWVSKLGLGGGSILDTGTWEKPVYAFAGFCGDTTVPRYLRREELS